jgi:uncharacterized protein DUF2877
MQIRAAASSALRDLLAGPPVPAHVLGSGPFALYLGTDDAVLAVLARDAVRLPCALTLSTSSAELPLTSLDPAGPVWVGEGAIRWPGSAGPSAIVVARHWAPARVRKGTSIPIDRWRSALSAFDCGVEARLIGGLTVGACEPAGSLLGRGPGLTPAGDDVLAGFLLGTRALGVPAGPLGRFVAEQAPAATTALSAQLLRHALRGECVPQVAAALAAPEDTSALAALLAVGHTSGTALARGLLRAAEYAAGVGAAATTTAA